MSRSRLPRTDSLLEFTELRALPWRRDIKKAAIASVLNEYRAKSDTQNSIVPSTEELSRKIVARLQLWTMPRPRRVLNTTGVLLHTNLGRAPLSPSAIAAMAEAAGACDLEADVLSGERGRRYAAIEPLMQTLFGAADVHLANNGAAALLLACTAIAATSAEEKRGGFALSRGQMVEIGDGFRIATMATAGGARLVEIGSTNRTHLRDYEAVLNDDNYPVAAILWVHRSNFSQSGFVGHPGLQDLSKLARRYDVPLIADLGSGAIHSLESGQEPTIQEYLAAGADIVTCSGDKLLGGPQCGVLAGSSRWIQLIRRHPMARALRPDKIHLAALHATLIEHAREADSDLVLQRMLHQTCNELQLRAERIVRDVGWPIDSIIASQATIGGGSLPDEEMESIAVRVPDEALKLRGWTKNETARRFRMLSPGVWGRIFQEHLHFDLRSLSPDDDDLLIAAIRRLFLESRSDDESSAEANADAKA